MTAASRGTRRAQKGAVHFYAEACGNLTKALRWQRLLAVTVRCSAPTETDRVWLSSTWWSVTGTLQSPQGGPHRTLTPKGIKGAEK